MKNNIKTFDVSGEGFYQHEINNINCEEGWCDKGNSFPLKCKCSGLIHADFGDENWNGYWLYKKCDLCGDNYEEVL